MRADIDVEHVLSAEPNRSSAADVRNAATVAMLDINNIFLNIMLLLGKMEIGIRLACRRAGDAMSNQPLNTEKDASGEAQIHCTIGETPRCFQKAHRIVMRNELYGSGLLRIATMMPGWIFLERLGRVTSCSPLSVPSPLSSCC
jgi:hypothetical protein